MTSDHFQKNLCNPAIILIVESLGRLLKAKMKSFLVTLSVALFMLTSLHNIGLDKSSTTRRAIKMESNLDDDTSRSVGKS